MKCPTCDQETIFTWRTAVTLESHGEMISEEWAECALCGAKTDQAELAKANPEDVQ